MRPSLTTRSSRSGKGRLAAVLAAAVVLAAACGSSSDDSSSPSGEAASGEVPTVDYDGTYGKPPTEVSEAPADKNVWVISCGQVAVGCAGPANAAEEAAKAVGWNVTLYDGKLGADNAYATGVRQALAAKADGIIIDSIDCAAIKQPLEEAKDAGVPTVAMLAYDCDDERLGGGDALFTGSVIPNEQNPTVKEYSETVGKAKAAWVLAQTDGAATALSLLHTDSLLGQDLAAGFDQVIEDCDTCELVSLPFTFAELGGGAVPAKVSQALLANPKINAVTTPYDSLMVLGVAQAIVRSGKSDEIAAIGGEGFSANLELILDDGGQDAAASQPAAWYGYAAVDSLIRLYNGDPLEPAGIGYQLVDADHMPEERDASGIIPPVDFKADYMKAWGL